MRYFFGFLFTIGLIILLIVLIFGGGGKSKVPSTTKSLVSYASTGSAASMTIEGPINADSLHQQIRVTVDRDNVNFEAVEGYEGKVVKSKSYANNQAAYTNFLHALTRASFTKGDTDKTLKDETGICPLGSRYVFKLIQDGEDLLRYWTTSCGSPKTYLGNLSMTLYLFQAQVPDYNKLTEDFNPSAN